MLSRSSSAEGKTSTTVKPGSPLATQFKGLNKNLAVGKQNSAVGVDNKKEVMVVQVQLDQDKPKTVKVEPKKTENDKNQEIEVVREAVDEVYTVYDVKEVTSSAYIEAKTPTASRPDLPGKSRSEERRVGEEWCGSGWSRLRTDNREKRH